MAIDSQTVFIKVSCFRKANKVNDALNNYAKTYGKVDQIVVLSISKVHESNEGSCLNVVHALISFKSAVNVSKFGKTAQVMILDKKLLPGNLSISELASMSSNVLMSSGLENIRHDLESAIRLYKIHDYSDAAQNFAQIMKLFQEEGGDELSLLFCVLVYCRCTALLNSRKVDAIQEGYETLMTLHDEMVKKFPLINPLLSKYEEAMRKPVTAFPQVKAKDLVKWPFQNLFEGAFPEADPEKAIKCFNLEEKPIKKKEKLAMCRYEKCQECFTNQPGMTHLTWTRMIVENEIDYRGFYRVICESRCKVEYHPFCWKNRKTKARVKSDKDLLGMICVTPDCNARIKEIKRYMENKENPIVIAKEPFADDAKVDENRNEVKKDEEVVDKNGKTDGNDLIRLLKEQIHAEAAKDLLIKELQEEKIKLQDQLQQARNETKASLEALKNMETRMTQNEEKINQLENVSKLDKEKIKQLEMDVKQKGEKYDKKEKEIISKCNKVIVELCKTICSKYLDDDPKFIKFITQLENNGAMNYKDAMRKAEQPSLLDVILKTAKEHFPGQSEDVLLTLVLEVKKNNNGSLKHITMNRIINDIRNHINNSILDDECSICMEPLNANVFKMNCCNKELCKSCIQTWQENKRDCPFCRRFTILDEEFPRLA